MYGNAEASNALPTNPTTEQRFTHLQEQIDGQHDRIRFAERAFEKEQKDRAVAIEEERRAREKAVTDIVAKVQRLTLGGVDLSLLGAIWLGSGIVFATIPEQLARWVR